MRALSLVCLLACGTGCFVELRAGMSMVTGANDPAFRPAPMLGISFGTALDTGTGRFSIGAGGDGLSTTLAGHDQVAVAGPVDMRIDVRPFGGRRLWQGENPSGFTLAGTFMTNDGKTLGRFTQNGAAWDQRPYGFATLFLGADQSLFLGSFDGRALLLDLALGAVVPLAPNNVGLTNLWGIGPQARVTLSLPFLLADALDATASIEGAAARVRWQREYEKTHPRPSALDEAVERIQKEGARDRSELDRQQTERARDLTDPNSKPPPRTGPSGAADVAADYEERRQQWEREMQEAMERELGPSAKP